MLYVVTDSRRTWWGLLDNLEAAGAQLIEVDSGSGEKVSYSIPSKLRVLRQMLEPRLLRLRHRWARDDAVFVLGWYLLPILVLIHARILTRPRKLVSMSVFVQSPAVRRVINQLWRLLLIPELEFVVGSAGEERRLIDGAGVPPERVHVLVLGGNLSPEVEVSPSGPSYIFTGGYTNRDYVNFFTAVETLPHRVIAVASARNRLSNVPLNVELCLDIPWGEFERLLAGASVVVLPLLEAGEVSGGSLLIRSMRYGAPFIVTRADGMIAHLGPEYAGYVPPGDADALRSAIDRAMTDVAFRQTLVDDLRVKREEFARLHSNPASEVLAICQTEHATGPDVQYDSSVT